MLIAVPCIHGTCTGSTQSLFVLGRHGLRGNGNMIIAAGFCSHPHHIVLGDLLFFVICLCNLCICMYCVVVVLYLLSEMVSMYIRVQHVCTYMCLYTFSNKCYIRIIIYL